MVIHLPKVYGHDHALLETLHYFANASSKLQWGKSHGLFKMYTWVAPGMNIISVQLCGTLEGDAQFLSVSRTQCRSSCLSWPSANQATFLPL